MNRSKMTWPDGYYVSYGYDAMSRMTTQTDSDGVALATRLYENVGRPAVLQYPFANDNISLSWSPQDELILLTHNLALAANDVTFTNSFTPAHQIKGAAISNAAFKYSPPASGTDTYPAVNGLNQYVSVTPNGGSAQTISYDTRGNLACAGTGCPTSTPSANAWVYTYDPENRMMTAGNGTVAAAFAYDPLGRRTQKSGTGVTTTYFVHDGDSEIAEYDSSGNLVRRFVPGAAVDQPVAMVTCGVSGCTGANATKTMFHTDKLGSIIAMSNASDGHLAAGPFTYDAYGNCVSGGSACSTAGTPYLYTGQRLDPETGLYYYRARYYSASLGRFMQTDPVGYAVDVNSYTYIGDDPLDNTDPYGLGPNTCPNKGSSECPTGTGTSGQKQHPDGGCGSRIKGGGDSVCRANAGNYNTQKFLGSKSGYAYFSEYDSDGNFVRVSRDDEGNATDVSDLLVFPIAAPEAAAAEGTVLVYRALDDGGEIVYVGITKNFEQRAARHLSEKGIEIVKIPGVSNLTRAEAKGVEQVLIELHGLGRNGGTLLNKINSIAKTNPKYAESYARGLELLLKAGYKGL